MTVTYEWSPDSKHFLTAILFPRHIYIYDSTAIPQVMPYHGSTHHGSTYYDSTHHGSTHHAPPPPQAAGRQRLPGLVV